MGVTTALALSVHEERETLVVDPAPGVVMGVARVGTGRSLAARIMGVPGRGLAAPTVRVVPRAGRRHRCRRHHEDPDGDHRQQHPGLAAQSPRSGRGWASSS